LLIRSADPTGDAAACAAIYAPFVNSSPVSFEDAAPGERELANRIADYTRSYPWLVAELDGAVAGFAYGAEHRTRAGYRWAVDVSVYVDPGAHRRGVGRALYGALLPMVREQGFHMACAGITLPNPASVALHESFGFEPVGVYRAIGWKAGAWRDVGWWQLQLIEPSPPGAGRQPPEPGPPARL